MHFTVANYTQVVKNASGAVILVKNVGHALQIKVTSSVLNLFPRAAPNFNDQLLIPIHNR